MTNDRSLPAVVGSSTCQACPTGHDANWGVVLLRAAAEDVVGGLVTIILALAIGLALAAGVTLGQFLVKPRNWRTSGAASV
jgi:hypothetical protein